MNKRTDYTIKGFAWLTFLVCLAVLLLGATACTPQSTRPFEPTKKVNVEEEQRKSIVPGGAPFSGMDCLKQVEYQIAYCEATLSCSSMQYKRLKRAARRLNKGFRSQCLYSKDHIQEVYRHMQRQRRNSPMGR